MEQNLVKEQNLKKLEEFFSCNLKIKELLYNLAPSNIDGYNQDSIIRYMDNFFDTLNEIRSQFSKITDSFNYKGLNEVIENHFQRYNQRLLNCNYSLDEVKRIYQDCCSNMRPELVSKAKEEFIGYTLFNGSVNTLVYECQSINEILHVIHSSITNNEKYYKSMPKISEKENDEGYPIVLYGRKNELAQKLFDDFPLEMSCGDTDIISLTNKTLIMIRDRGHATSIEIDIEGDNLFVKYFIPKICNIDMINNLKGINKVNSDMKVTTGAFGTTKENLSKDIIDFINGIPMDKDMVFDFINTQSVYVPSQLEGMHLAEEKQANTENTQLVEYKQSIWQKIISSIKEKFAQIKNKISKKTNLNDIDIQDSVPKSNVGITGEAQPTEKLQSWDMRNWTPEEISAAKQNSPKRESTECIIDNDDLSIK